MSAAPERIGKWDPELFASFKAATGERRRRLLGQLLEENLPLVKTLTDQLLGRGSPTKKSIRLAGCQGFNTIEWDEAIQAGRIAFMKAAEGFDASRGKIAWYLKLKIRYELQCLLGRGKTRIELGYTDDDEALARMGGVEVDGVTEVGEFTPDDVAEWERTGEWPDTVEEALAQRQAAEEHAAILAATPSPLQLFAERHLVFKPSARVAAIVLYGRFESALWPSPAPRSTVRQLLRERGAKEAFIRTPWAASARAFRGVGVRPTVTDACASSVG